MSTKTSRAFSQVDATTRVLIKALLLPELSERASLRATLDSLAGGAADAAVARELSGATAKASAVGLRRTSVAMNGGMRRVFSLGTDLSSLGGGADSGGQSLGMEHAIGRPSMRMLPSTSSVASSLAGLDEQDEGVAEGGSAHSGDSFLGYSEGGGFGSLGPLAERRDSQERWSSHEQESVTSVGSLDSPAGEPMHRFGEPSDLVISEAMHVEPLATALSNTCGVSADASASTAAAAVAASGGASGGAGGRRGVFAASPTPSLPIAAAASSAAAAVPAAASSAVSMAVSPPSGLWVPPPTGASLPFFVPPNSASLASRSLPPGPAAPITPATTYVTPPPPLQSPLPVGSAPGAFPPSVSALATFPASASSATPERLPLTSTASKSQRTAALLASLGRGGGGAAQRIF